MQKFFAWVSILSLLLQLTSSIFLYGPVYADPSSKLGPISVGSQTGTLTADIGGSATYTITINRAGSGKFDANLTVDTTLPTGATFLFSPSTVTLESGVDSVQSTLTITTTSLTPAGSATFTVHAQNGTEVSTNTGILLINEGNPTTPTPTPTSTLTPTSTPTPTPTPQCSVGSYDLEGEVKGDGYTNGNLCQGSGDCWAEGENVPARLTITGLTAGDTYTVVVEHDYQDSAGTIGYVNFNSPTSGNSTATGISFGTPTNVSCTGNTCKDYNLTFTAQSSTVQLDWLALLSLQAGDWNGATLHFRLVGGACGENIGNKDVPISPNKIVITGSITPIKSQANGANPSEWTFNITGNTSVSGVTSNSTASNLSLGANNGDATYTITEVGPAGWILDSVSQPCAKIGDFTASVTLTAQTSDVTCTFTNIREAGNIVINKTIVGGNGESNRFDFAISPVNYQPTIITNESSASTGPISVPTGTGYSVTETTTGWNTSVQCLNDAGAPVDNTDFEVTVGGTITCNFTNTKSGHIIVNKVTNPSADPQSFSFTTGGAGYSGFSLTDASTPNDQELLPGNYSVVETGLTGWTLTNTSCVSSLQDIETADNLELDAGETITCTFINTKHGHFIVNKETDPASDTATQFSVTATGDHVFGEVTRNVTGGSSIDYEVMPGTYSATESNLPAGWQQYTNSCTEIVVVPGQSHDCYIHNTKLGSVSGYKYDATSGLGLLGWTIYLYNTISQATSTAITDSQGFYSFINLWPSTYELSELLQGGWTQISAPTNPINLSADENVINRNFVNFQNISITACKIIDADGDVNTTKDQTNKYGWTVSLSSGQRVDTQTTGENGCYTWTNLGPGTYDVSETVPAGWTALTPTAHSFVAQSGQNQSFTFINFNNGQISGDKFNDINGDGNQDEGELNLPGWTIYLDTNNNGQLDSGEPSQVTDGSGHYLFSNLGPGTYHVREVGQIGWIQTEPGVDGSYTIEMTSSGEETQKDFGNQGNLSITACKYEDSNGILPDGNFTPVSNWNFALGQTSPQNTGEDNCTIFNNLTPGTYDVTELPLPAGWFIADDSQGTKRVVLTNQNQTVDFYNYRQGSISGMKFEDINGNGVKDPGDNGINGWRIYLDLNNDNDFDTGEPSVMTSGGGNYSFGSLTPGDYTIREVLKSGWSQTAPAAGEYNITLISGQNETGKNFGNFKLSMMQGLKFNDLDGDGLPREVGEEYMNGWKFRLYTSWENPVEVTTSNTGETGQYRFSNLSTGTYQVCEVLQDGWTQTWPNIGDNPVEDNGTIRPEHGVAVANESGEPDEAGVCWQTTITQSNDSNTYLRFGNSQKGTIIVRKVTDPREAEESFDIDLKQETVVHTYTLGDGDSKSYDTLSGQYILDEQQLAGWDLTDATCFSDEERANFNPREGFTLNPGETIDCTFTNTIKNPALTITKKNDATGDRHPGDSVLFTLTVTTTQSGVRNVQVTDVLPDGFKYRSGSWTASSNLNPLLAVGEPTYASPGVWNLGNMVKGETITLTYIADIDGSQDPGLYKDLAWAQGKSLRGCGTVVLALAMDPGFVSENFVGTQVNVIKDQQSGVTYNVENQVLGASTSLPATGSQSGWLVLALILAMLGLGSLALGVILKRKYA